MAVQKQELFIVNRIFLQFMAAYPLDENANSLKRFIFYVWRTICISFLCILCCQFLVDILVRSEFDLVDITDNILNIGLYMGAAIRIIYFYVNGSKLKEIFEKLKLFETESAVGVYKQSLDNWIKAIKCISCVWYCNVFFVCEFLVLLPLFLKSTERNLPLPAWYPMKTTESPYFQLFYVYEALTNIFMGYSYANGDLTFIYASTSMAGQLRILGCNMKNIYYTSLLKYGVAKDTVFKYSQSFNSNGDIDGQTLPQVDERKLEINAEIEAIMKSEAFKKELHKSLSDCIDQYRQIIDYCQMLEKFCSPVMFTGILFAMFYLIFATFCGVITNDSRRFSLFLYTMTATSEIFVLTFFAQMLTTESEELNNSLYECPWYLGSRKFKSTYIIFKHNIMKPIVLTAGPFINLSLPTFLIILKATFSYLTFLRQSIERT